MRSRFVRDLLHKLRAEKISVKLDFNLQRTANKEAYEAFPSLISFMKPRGVLARSSGKYPSRLLYLAVVIG